MKRFFLILPVFLWIVIVSYQFLESKITNYQEEFYGGESRLDTLFDFVEATFGENTSELKIRLDDKTKTEIMLKQIISDQQSRYIVSDDLHINQMDLQAHIDRTVYIDNAIINKLQDNLNEDSSQISQGYVFSGIELDLRESLNGTNLSRLSNVKITDQYLDEKGVILESSNVEDAHIIDFLLVFTSDELIQRRAIPFRLLFAETFKSEDYNIISVIGRNGYKAGTFRLPYGTEIYENLLWTTDCVNENISVFTLDGEFIDSFSQYGQLEGQLNTPADIKIDNGKIYVAEELNNRIQIFNLQGQHLDSFNTYNPTKDGKFSVEEIKTPLGVAIKDENILVVDYGNNQVIYFDNKFQTLWISNNKKNDIFEWNDPYYAEVLNDDTFVVSNKGANQISLISKEGIKIKSFGEAILQSPHEIAVDKDQNIIVADTNNFRLVKFLKSSDYENYESIQFPKSYGFPKTVAIQNDTGLISIGFIGSGSAYFLIMKNKSTHTNNLFQYNYTVEFTNKPSSGLNKDSDDFDIQKTYLQFCASCHEGGRYGAPMTGNLEDWNSFSKDLDVLTQIAIEGKGAMIERGGCYWCSDSQIRDLVEYLVPRTW